MAPSIGCNARNRSIARVERMRQQGRITTWNDDKGFGFITRNGDGPIVFVHVHAFSDRRRRPLGGELVTYAIGRDAKGRPRAVDVAFVGAPKAPPTLGAPNNVALIAGLLFLATLAAMGQAGKLPWAVVATYAIASGVTLFAYGLDKASARSGRRRTPENTLHVLAVLGGWPGAAIAQRVLRHKNRKTSFLVVFWLTVLINVGALAWLLTTEGQRVLEAAIG